ncbi:TVP38/TMEM64 family protein [Microbacterium sp. gxy059]|uniref:TVP38/TMEM64 family protein n=1 Tax=Microbacterium sp. gxy059 TaxID=2957199 RepID=UPI003D98AB98
MTDGADTGAGPADPSAAAASPPAHGIRWGAAVRNSLLVLALLGMIWLALHVRLPSIDELRGALEQWGGAAWIAFVLLYAVVAITPIPVTIMAIAGGVLFGVLEGSILSVVGAMIGSWIAYWLARGLGRTTVAKLLGSHAETVERRLAGAGVEAVYLLRLMPGLPYWPVNYGSGAFGISQRDFLAGSGLSTIPGQVSLVAVGAFIADPGLPAGIVVLCAWAVVLVMTFFAYRRLRRASGRGAARD